jgi:hypothetical protein
MDVATLHEVGPIRQRPSISSLLIVVHEEFVHSIPHSLCPLKFKVYAIFLS